MRFFSELRAAFAVGGACAALLLPAQVHAQIELSKFETKTGICSALEYQQLEASTSTPTGSYTIKPSRIYSAFGANPRPTDAEISPITPVTCLDRQDKHILVTAEDKDSGIPFCGWVLEETLLQSLDDTSPLYELGGRGACTGVYAQPMSSFCSKYASKNEAGVQHEACEYERTREAVFNAKFIVENTNRQIAEQSSDLKAIEVPIYSLPDGTEQSGTAPIFSVLRIFDVQRNEEGKFRYLIGAGQNKVLGWMEDKDGTVWPSKLATFFASGATKDIFFDQIGDTDNDVIASPPDNLERMLSGWSMEPADPNYRQYQRYPVLEDLRRSESGAAGHTPQLKIAVIGSLCQKGPGEAAVCTEVDGKDPVDPGVYSELNETDVLFLIDGTGSMRRYFGLTANAVAALSSKYVGDLDLQFAVAMYGDYTSRGATELTSPMQYRYLRSMDTIFEEGEFDNLSNVELYLDDALADKPEASNSALYRAVTETPWRGTAKKMIIHIADHGDRRSPPDALLEVMRSNRVIYSPIAVRGDGVIGASDNFVTHSGVIEQKHRTINGSPLAFVAAVTYENEAGAGSTQEDVEYTAILQSLRFSMDLSEKLRDRLVEEQFGTQTDPQSPTGPTPTSPNEAVLYPPGHAALTDAIFEMLRPDLPGLDAKPENRTLAVTGFVETTPIGQEDPNWENFAALVPSRVTHLQTAFERLCLGLQDNDASEDMYEAIKTLIEVLTGDQLDDPREVEAYFNDREKLPLSTQTLLGNGLPRLIGDLANPTPAARSRVKHFTREVCRSATLVKLVNSGARLRRPYDGDGDLVWSEQTRSYDYRNAVLHNWVYTDAFEFYTTFLPLDYLPRLPENASR